MKTEKIVLTMTVALAITIVSCGVDKSPPGENTVDPTGGKQAGGEIMTPGKAGPVSVEELKERQFRREEFILIDTRPREGYDREHLSGAISIQPEEIEARHQEWPKDKPIIVYGGCPGLIGSPAEQAGNKLQGLGFNRVQYLRPGFPELKRSGCLVVAGPKPGMRPEEMELAEITAEEFKTRLDKQEQLFIVDARKSSEFAEGHIAGAVSIPFPRLQQDRDTFPEDRMIIIYCEDGRASRSISRMLQMKGIANISTIRGGLREWRKNGFPMVSRDDRQ